MDPNPRKTLRKQAAHLQSEIGMLEKRLNKFKQERQRLLSIEKNGTIEEARRVAEGFNCLDWLAFPVY